MPRELDARWIEAGLSLNAWFRNTEGSEWQVSLQAVSARLGVRRAKL